MDAFFLHFIKESAFVPTLIGLAFMIQKLNNKIGLLEKIFTKKFEMVDDKLVSISKNIHAIEDSINEDIGAIKSDLKEAKADTKEVSKLVHENNIELARLKEKTNKK